MQAFSDCPDLNDIEARLLGPPRRRHVELLELGDLLSGHLVAGVRPEGVAWDLRDATRAEPALEVEGVLAVEAQLDAGQGAVFVHLGAHQRPVAHVVVVPDAARGGRPLVGLGVDRRPLRVGDRIAALGLHGTVVGVDGRPVGAEARTLRGRIEAVAQHLGPDRHGLEEDVVARVSCHWRHLN